MLEGVFDAHVHVIDPRFPLIENNGYLPPPFTVDDYRARMAGLGVTGGAVVSGSFQGSDHTYLVAALAELGSGWVGVIQLDENARDRDIARLDRRGVRGLRFNLSRGAIDIELLVTQARRAYDLVGWHAEFYVDGPMLARLVPDLPVAAQRELATQVGEGQRSAFDERHARRVEAGRKGPRRPGGMTGAQRLHAH